MFGCWSVSFFLHKIPMNNFCEFIIRNLCIIQFCNFCLKNSFTKCFRKKHSEWKVPFKSQILHKICQNKFSNTNQIKYTFHLCHTQPYLQFLLQRIIIQNLFLTYSNFLVFESDCVWFIYQVLLTNSIDFDSKEIKFC